MKALVLVDFESAPGVSHAKGTVINLSPAKFMLYANAKLVKESTQKPSASAEKDKG